MADLTQEQITKAIELCETMLIRSYCVYSNFPVASVLITDTDEMIPGCNVENASYGLAICAERTAAVKAVSEGHKKFKACFVMANLEKSTAPCGACRQFLAEFGLDMVLYLLDKNRKYVTYKLRDLLPLAFIPSDLNIKM